MCPLTCSSLVVYFLPSPTNGLPSGLKIAQVVEELLEIQKFDLVAPNIRVAEQLETQRLMNAGQNTLDTEQAAVQVESAGQPELNVV